MGGGGGGSGRRQKYAGATICAADTHSMETHLAQSFPDISRYTYERRARLRLSVALARMSRFLAEAGGEAGLQRSLDEFKRRRASGATPRGVILARLYAFVGSKRMCVFSPLPLLLCVADSSQDLTESSPPPPPRRAACYRL